MSVDYSRMDTTSTMPRARRRFGFTPGHGLRPSSREGSCSSSTGPGADCAGGHTSRIMDEWFVHPSPPAFWLSPEGFLLCNARELERNPGH